MGKTHPAGGSNPDQPGSDDPTTDAAADVASGAEPPDSQRIEGKLGERPGRPLLAAAASVLWPGAGHLATGWRRRGGFIASATVAVLVITLWLISRQRRTAVVAWSVQPGWLRAAIAISTLVLIYRIVVAWDAYRRNRTPERTALHWLVLALLAIVTAFPHVRLTQYALTQLDLLDTVFTATETHTARPSPLPSDTTTSTVVVTTTSSPPATTVASEAPASSTTAAPATTSTTTTTLPTWDGDERLTILLLGGDGGFDRTGIRTDTIMALSIEVATGDAVAFSIPRNWQRMQWPSGTPAGDRFPSGYQGLANQVYDVGLRYPELFPEEDNPGGASIKASIAQLLGTPVQYYALVDMIGVVDAIDLFGGVDITVTEYIDDNIRPITAGGPRLPITVSPGDYHMDGLTALAYMRARTTSSDYHRMSRQRCVVGALIDQVSVGSVLSNYPDLANIISDHLTTDIPLDRLPELLDLASRLDTSRITTVNFIPPEFARGAAPIEDVRAAVQEAFELETESSFDDLVGACDGEE